MSAAMREQFYVAVERVLNSWTVLKLAVSHGFGGRDSEAKAEWMVSAVDQFFSENANLDQYEVEDFLEDIMNTEFDTLVDDGSIPQIAQMICGFYKLCQSGKEEELKEKLGKLPKPALSHCKSASASNGAVDSDSEDGSGMEHDPPPHSTASDTTTPSTSNTKNDDQGSMDVDMVEDDGWTTVGKKGKRR